MPKSSSLADGAKTYYRPIEAAIRWSGLLRFERRILAALGERPLPEATEFPRWPMLRLNTERIFDALAHGEMPYGKEGLVRDTQGLAMDDPSLTVRFGDDTAFEPPLRVVLDPGLATVARGNVRQGEAPTLYVHTADATPPRGTDVQRMVAPATGSNFDLKVVLELLAERGINEVHAEAGATLAGAFIAAGLADEVLLYVAPVLLGDQARPLFGGLGIQAMADRLKLEIVDSRMIGEDHRLLLQPAR